MFVAFTTTRRNRSSLEGVALLYDQYGTCGGLINIPLGPQMTMGKCSRVCCPIQVGVG